MNMTVEHINTEILERLRGLYATGHLAHAYLFSGPAGAGKSDTALALALAVNCLEPSGFKPGCHCVSCRKMLDGNHPDLFILQKLEDRTEIIIGQFIHKEGDPYQPLLPWLGVRALEARIRVVIIKDADLLNAQAANAFLKTLEEPRPGTLFILTTSSPGNILKTVLSRCHEVRFFSPMNSPLVGGVKTGYDVASRGNKMIDEFIFGPASEALFKKWSEDKDNRREMLSVVLTFYRDVLCVQNGAADDALHYGGRAADIRRVAGRIKPEEAQAVAARAVKAIEAVNENFNVKLALILLKETIR